jgi:D-glucosaminate-6-phosphate ammonia-lyase
LSYADIGVRSFINCCGTRTINSDSLMLPCVRDAMMEASRAFVNMDELMEGVGSRLAALTGAESAIVTSGGAAALCVAAAAAVTGGDPERIQRLPQLQGRTDRVVMLTSGRFTYDQTIRAVGATIVEVETIKQLTAELANERTALVALLGSDEAGLISIETIAALANPRVIPLLVDAASEHLRNPNPYLEAGATMVAYSGGKYLRGPQCTGLLLGSGPWVPAAWTNAAPHHTFARMMKVGKEEIMGLLAAVEHWSTERDDDVERQSMVRLAGDDLESCDRNRWRDYGDSPPEERQVADAATADYLAGGLDARIGTASGSARRLATGHAG